VVIAEVNTRKDLMKHDEIHYLLDNSHTSGAYHDVFGKGKSNIIVCNRVHAFWIQDKELGTLQIEIRHIKYTKVSATENKIL